jgi:hypothetical protein
MSVPHPAPPPPPSPPPEPPRRDDDDFEAPESDSFKKLVRHIIDEMPGHVIVAVALVAFMFFYGMANSLFKLSGRELASIDFPLGVVTGLVGSVGLTAWILCVKYRRR